jgi:hypothetical protein
MNQEMPTIKLGWPQKFSHLKWWASDLRTLRTTGLNCKQQITQSGTQFNKLVNIEIIKVDCPCVRKFSVIHQKV